MPLGAVVVHADDGHRLALRCVLGGDRIQRGDGGGVPDVRVAHVDDDVGGVAHVVELVHQVIAGGEEQLSPDRVDAGVGGSLGSNSLKNEL